NFPIRPRPTITSLQPNPTPAGGTTTLSVTGTNFVLGDTVLVGSSGCFLLSCLTPLNTTFNSANNLSGALPGSLIPTIGNYNVFVENSLTALSQPLTLTVGLGITNLSPSSTTQGVTPLPTLTVT